MKHKIFYSIFPVFIPWISFWNQFGPTVKDLSKAKVAVAKNCDKPEDALQWNAVFALTNASREKGLGGVKEPLGHGDAMLFVFEKPMKVSFWMKDTLIPLQIGYFDAKGKLTQTYEMPIEKNPADPKGIYTSRTETMVAIEVAPKSIKKTSGMQLCLEKPRTP